MVSRISTKDFLEAIRDFVRQDLEDDTSDPAPPEHRVEILCLCGDIFPTIGAMHGHIHMVHDEDLLRLGQQTMTVG